MGHGADAGHGCHHHVLHRADIDVGIGTHHRRVAAGAHCVVQHHRVREGFASLCVVHQLVNGALFKLSGANRTDDSTRHSPCRSRTDQLARQDLQILTRLIGHVKTSHQRQVHHVRVVERGTLGQRVGAVGTRWVAQDVEQQGLSFRQDALRRAYGVHVEHVGLQRLSLEVGAVTLNGERHRAQAVAHVRRLVGLQGEDAPTQAV